MEEDCPDPSRSASSIRGDEDSRPVSDRPSGPQGASDDPVKITEQRLAACDELLRAVGVWVGDYRPPRDASWLVGRQTELFVRAIQTMQGTVVVARQGLWVPAYALARLLLEDAAVAHWLAVHPHLAALETRWTEHLDAARFGDFKAQQELHLDIDSMTAAWVASSNLEYLKEVARRHRDGTSHWTGKSIAALLAGAAGRAAPDRNNWGDRARQLMSANRRMQLIVNLGVHHSPAASQNWYAPPSEMLPDGLRTAWLVFGLHAALAVEELVPERFADLQQLLERQAKHFWMGPPANA